MGSSCDIMFDHEMNNIQVVSDDELPDIPDNARIDNNYENTEDKKRQRSRSPSLSSLDSWGARYVAG